MPDINNTIASYYLERDEFYSTLPEYAEEDYLEELEKAEEQDLELARQHREALREARLQGLLREEE